MLLQLLTAEKTQVCKRVTAGHNFGSFLLRNVIKTGGFFLFLSFSLHMRHSEMDIKTRIMTQEHQAGRAEQALQCKREEEKIAAASTFQGQLYGRETRGCRLWNLVAPSITSVCFYEVGLQGRILHIVTIFQDSGFWEALQYCDKPDLKNCVGNYEVCLHREIAVTLNILMELKCCDLSFTVNEHYKGLWCW